MSEEVEKNTPNTGSKHIFLECVHVHKSLSLLSLRFITLEIIFISSLFIIHAFISVFQMFLISYGNIVIPEIYFISLLTLYKAVLMMCLCIQWQNEKYSITTSKIIHEKGVFFKKKEIYDYSHITLIDIKQGVFGKILNFGSIHLTDPFINKDIYLDDIHNPERYYHMLRELSPKIDAVREIVQGDIIQKEEVDEFENMHTFVTTFSNHKKTFLT